MRARVHTQSLPPTTLTLYANGLTCSKSSSLSCSTSGDQAVMSWTVLSLMVTTVISPDFTVSGASGKSCRNPRRRSCGHSWTRHSTAPWSVGGREGGREGGRVGRVGPFCSWTTNPISSTISTVLSKHPWVREVHGPKSAVGAYTDKPSEHVQESHQTIASLKKWRVDALHRDGCLFRTIQY